MQMHYFSLNDEQESHKIIGCNARKNSVSLVASHDLHRLYTSVIMSALITDLDSHLGQHYVCSARDGCILKVNVSSLKVGSLKDYVH